MEAPATKKSTLPPPAVNPPAPAPPIVLHRPPSRWPVVLIALDKFTKATGLVIVSFFLTRLPEHRDAWVDFVTQLHILRPLHKLLVWALSLSDHQLRNAHIIVIVLAGLYLIEGAGLIWDLKWAEWLVAISTASFIPLEIYEIWRESTLVKWAVLVINIGIFAYLAFRLHRLAQVKHEHEALAQLAGLPPDPKK